jgi:hypothetical protein
MALVTVQRIGSRRGAGSEDGGREELVELGEAHLQLADSRLEPTVLLFERGQPGLQRDQGCTDCGRESFARRLGLLDDAHVCQDRSAWGQLPEG